QIVAFVNAVLDAVVAIAGGGAGGVPGLIEKALAASIPVLIGALAAILGIGGIADKVKSFFQTLTKPVMKAIDRVIDRIVKAGKAIWAKLKARFGGKPKKEESPEDKARRLQRGMSAAESALAKFGGRSVGRALLGPVLAGIRIRYGLTTLELV